MLCAQLAGEATHSMHAGNACPCLFERSGPVLTSVEQRLGPITRLRPGYYASFALRDALGKYRDALCEAFAAYRDYQRLTSNRVPHSTALRAAFRLDEECDGCWRENWRKPWTTKNI